MTARRVFALTALNLATVFGCAVRANEPKTYGISVLVEADPQTPLAGAVVLRDGVNLATTGANGRATVQLRGAEGELIQVNVRCPAGYTSPSLPLEISLRSQAGTERLPSYRVSCPPETRNVVVAVRATNGADLPVRYLGKEVARTDASGAAHVALRLRPGERFELSLDTAPKPTLLPKSPSAVFVTPDHDELLVFEQRFTAPAAQKAVRRGPRQF